MKDSYGRIQYGNPNQVFVRMFAKMFAKMFV